MEFVASDDKDVKVPSSSTAAVEESLLTTAEEPGIKIENFIVTLDTLCASGQVYYMKSSCFIWLGMTAAPAKLAQFDVTVPTKYDPIPITTTLINESEASTQSSVGIGLITRLSKKFGIQIFSSNNIDSDNELLWQLIEKRLIELLSVRY